MESNEPSIHIPEDTDRGNPSKRQKLSAKQLFKMKIGDLQSLEHDPAADCFKFKNHELSLVICGGQITDIFRDDYLFSFELDDGTGSISCIHRYRFDREDMATKLSELPTSARFLQTTISANQTRIGDDTVFNTTNENTVIRNLEKDTANAFEEIKTWFREEIVEKPETRNIGDFIHLTGHLMQGEGIRKIIVIDFRMATKEERQDLANEIEYLNRCVY